MWSSLWPFIEAALPLALGIAGAYVSFYPPDTEPAKRKWLIAFVVLGVLGAAASVVDNYQDGEFQDSLFKKIDLVAEQTKQPPSIVVTLESEETVKAPARVAAEVRSSLLSVTEASVFPSPDRLGAYVILKVDNVGQRPITANVRLALNGRTLSESETLTVSPMEPSAMELEIRPSANWDMQRGVPMEVLMELVYQEPGGSFARFIYRGVLTSGSDRLHPIEVATTAK